MKNYDRLKSIIEPLNKEGKLHVALLYGGMSLEREVSISSHIAASKALVNNGYRVTSIDMGRDIASVLEQIKPDLVFNSLHGTYGEDGCIQGVLNILKIPYTNSGLLSSAICFNKERTREILLPKGINFIEAIKISKLDNYKHDPMPRPYVIKPLSEGSSLGIEVIFEGDDFDFSQYKFEYGNEVLIEKYIKGKEIQVPVLNGKSLGVLEIEVLKNRFYDYQTKYTDGFANHIYPARLNREIYQQAKILSEKIYKIMGCRGIARVEYIFCDKTNQLYTLEINTHPGMTPLSICPEVANYEGINFNELIEKIIETADYGD